MESELEEYWAEERHLNAKHSDFCFFVEDTMNIMESCQEESYTPATSSAYVFECSTKATQPLHSIHNNVIENIT